MEDTDVLIPVRCAYCGATALNSFPVIVVITALTRWRQMRLYSSCHGVAWSATQAELDLIREHLGERWLESHCNKLMVRYLEPINRSDFGNGAIPTNQILLANKLALPRRPVRFPKSH